MFHVYGSFIYLLKGDFAKQNFVFGMGTTVADFQKTGMTGDSEFVYKATKIFIKEPTANASFENRKSLNIFCGIKGSASEVAGIVWCGSIGGQVNECSIRSVGICTAD